MRDVVIVEDEPIIAIFLESILKDLCHNVVGSAGTLKQAIELADKIGRADVAIMDVNLCGEMSYPAARIFVQRKISVILVSGYAHASPPDELKHIPLLKKPYSFADIEEAINLVSLAGNSEATR